MKGDYFHRLNQGYQCSVCLTIYTEPFARQKAKTCCSDKKPLSLTTVRQAEAILTRRSHRLTPRTARPGDGILYKDRWGHWHRPKHIPHYGHRYKADFFSTYHKAQAKIQRQHDHEVCSWLNRLMPEFDVDDLFKRRTTALQRLSFAFINQNWDGVKAAAYDLAEETVAARLKHIARRAESHDRGLVNENEG